MKYIKYLIYKIFGLKTYLQIVSKTYIRLISIGLGKSQYPEIHYLKQIVKPGSHCIDIGANLGYYSYFMSKYAGASGKVYSIEPIPLFGEIWKKNVARTGFNNIELLPYALGAEEKKVTMGMPVIDGTVHHGMTKIIDSNSQCEKTFEVQMQVPDTLFQNLPKIDFVKIDIEGYEHVAFANMKNLLKRDKPLIQSELGGEENRKECFAILNELGYKPYILQEKQLTEIPVSEINDHGQDFYWKHILTMCLMLPFFIKIIDGTFF